MTPTLAAALARAQTCHREGNLVEAERCYREIVAGDPQQFAAVHALAILCAQSGRIDEAQPLAERAMQIDPRSTDAKATYANVLQALDRQSDALAIWDDILTREPDIALALYNRGNLLLGIGRFADALNDYDRVIALMPDNAAALYNRGCALQQLQRYEEALESYERVVSLIPDNFFALHNRGAALLGLNRYEAALASFDHALTIEPNDTEALTNRGVALYELNRFAEALTSYDKALAINSGYVAALNNRGNALLALNRPAEALASFDQALAIKPDFVAAMQSKGNVLQYLNRHEEAAEIYGRALAVAPDDAFVSCMLLHSKLQSADWSGYDEHARRVITDAVQGKGGVTPLAFLAVSDSAEHQLSCARTWVKENCPPSAAAVWKGEKYRHPKIRVAYISGDLREHPVSYLLAGLFEAHDRSRFEPIAISFGPPAVDEMRTRLEGAFERFIDVGDKSDAEVAELLRMLEVDIAVDLMGFTTHSRAKIFASRPVPVQVNYLGFPGTMGAAYIDYIIADSYVVPQERCHSYAEKVVYLPDTFQANDPERRIAQRVPARTQVGLPDQGFVFCCFNNTYKITPRIFDVWMRLLQKVEGSVMWLLASNDVTLRNLQSAARERGVDPGRLIFAPPTSYADHLARYKIADLFLDNLPFNAGATASDALWAGLPLLTCSGDAFASRMAGSLLKAIGLPELITDCLNAYEQRALELATNERMMAEIRAKLARNRDTHPLFDTDRFRRHIEAAYVTMWERSQRGEPPASFAVPLAV